MEAGAGRVGPGAVAGVPGGDDPAFAVGGSAGDVRIREDLVVVGLLGEVRRAFEHHAVLHAQVAEAFLAAVGQPHLHTHHVLTRAHVRAEDDAVRQASLHAQRSVGVAFPLERFQGHALLGPHRVDVRVGQIGQPQVRPDRLGHIDHEVAGVIPRRENADLRFALRPNGPVEKADPRMPPAGIRQDQQRRVRRPFRLGGWADAEPHEGRAYFRFRESRRRRDLRRRKPVMPDHVLEPIPKLGLVGGSAMIGHRSGRDGNPVAPQPRRGR